MRHVGEIDGRSVCITDHALSRLVEMGLSAEQIKLLVSEPEEVYPSKKYPGSFCHRRGEHALAFVEENGCLIVKTALYSTLVDWMKADREGKLGDERMFRPDVGIRRF